MPKVNDSHLMPPPTLHAESSSTAFESAPTTSSTPITPSSPQHPPTLISSVPTPLSNQQRESLGSNEFGQTTEESYMKLLSSRLTSAQESTDFNETAAQEVAASAPTSPWDVPEPYPDSFLDKYIATCREDDEGDYEGAAGWGRLYTKLHSDGELTSVCTIDSLLRTLGSFFKEDFVLSVRRYYFGLVEQEKAAETLNAYFSIFCIRQLEVLISIFSMEFEFDEWERERMQAKADDGGSKKGHQQKEEVEEREDRLREEVAKICKDGSGERVGLGGNDEGREKGGRDGGLCEKVPILRDINQVKRIRKYPRGIPPNTVKVSYEHMQSQPNSMRTTKSGEIPEKLQETLQKRCTAFEKAARDIISQDTKELGDTFNIGDTKSAQDEGLLFHSEPLSGFSDLVRFQLGPTTTNTLTNLSTGPAFLLSNSISVAFLRSVLINPQVRDKFREPIVVLAFKVPRRFFAEERKGTLGGEETLKEGGPLLSMPNVSRERMRTLTKEEFLASEEKRIALDDWFVENFDKEEDKGKLLSFVRKNLEPGMSHFLSRSAAAQGKTEGVDVVIAPWVDPQQSQAGVELIAGGMFRAATPGVTSLQVACTSPESMAELLRYHYQNYEEDLDGLTVGRC